MYARRTCINPMCGKTFRPRREKDRLLLDHCSKECLEAGSFAVPAPRNTAKRVCSCGSMFQVPKRAPDELQCAQCRSLAAANAVDGLPAPLVQCVFDLETWGLDLGWGTVLCGSGITFDGVKPRKWTYAARDFGPWKEGRRSDYSALMRVILDELLAADILIAHNGREFDIKIVNTAALKYDYPHILDKKVFDPVQQARRAYRIGGNSLDSWAEFLGLNEQKMKVPREVWRQVMMDDTQEDWETLIERCESDVRVLVALARRFAPHAGDINNRGSAAR